MDTVEFALACHRTPLAYQAWLAPNAPLPGDMDRLLWLANGSPDASEAAVRQTGAKPEELQEAARFCVQQMCFSRGADHYRLLAVNPGTPLERIKEHHRLLMRLFHPDRAAGRESWTDHYAARVNEAWTALSRLHDEPAQESQPILWPMVVAEPSRSPPWYGEYRQSRHAVENITPHFGRSGQWLPVLVLSGLALMATLVLAAIYLTGRPAVRTLPVASSPSSLFSPSASAIAEAPAALPDHQGAIAALLATPNWELLEQREQEVRQQVLQTQEARRKLEQSRQEQLAIEEGLMKRMRAERVQLEEQLKAEQTRAERVWSERVIAERARLEKLKTEQAQLEQAKADPVKKERIRQEELLKTERARFEQARLERIRLEEQLKVEQTKAERVRLEEQLKAERTRLEQARLERLQLEQQLKAQPVKTQPAPLAIAALSVPQDVGLTTRELDDLIDRYTRAYERGDVNGILALFTDSAQNDRNRVRRDYSAFFAKNEVRQLSLQLRWNPRGAFAGGVGRYELQAQRRSDGQPQQAGGAIRFSVRKQDGRVLIDAIEYD